MEEGISLHKIAKIGCISFIFYIFWFKYSFRQINLFLYAAVFAAAGSMILDLWFYQKNITDFCPVGVLINLVMVVYSLVTGIWVAIYQDTVISLSKTYACYTAVCIVICYVSKEEGSIDWIINSLIAACIVISVFLIVKGYPVEGYGYVLGPAQNPNLLGLIMAVGLFCLAYKSRKGTEHIGLYLCIAMLFVYSIVNSGSRKSLLAGGIIIILWMVPLVKKIWDSSNNNVHFVLIVAAVLIVGGAVYYFTTEFINTDIYKRLQQLGDDDEFSSRARKLYYVFALDYWAERPFFGIGLGQFQYWNPYRQMSHSTYAESISCWGLIGCLIYYMPVFTAGLRAVSLSFSSKDAYVPRIVLAVLAMEFFLGIGQVWFYEIEHQITWTLIYYLIDDQLTKVELEPRRVYKYVKA
ncbi:MAG: O-antigen ligase family protein [Clostridia bacterium]|nr:O-antigen ligase family protein [Clostridia bacterium]